jgi:hypothetical protein
MTTAAFLKYFMKIEFGYKFKKTASKETVFGVIYHLIMNICCSM